MLCQIVREPNFQNLTLKCCFLTWRKVSENIDCCPKMVKKTFIEPARGGIVFFDCIRAINDEKNFYFPLTRSKKV